MILNLRCNTKLVPGRKQATLVRPHPVFGFGILISRGVQELFWKTGPLGKLTEYQE
jgi:hypothetical protein